MKQKTRKNWTVREYEMIIIWLVCLLVSFVSGFVLGRTRNPRIQIPEYSQSEVAVMLDSAKEDTEKELDAENSKVED